MKYKAIIVDDESLARDMLQEMITLANPDIKIVAMCEDVPEAVKAINKFRPDVVFLDVDMPRYKGIDIAEFFDVMDFDIVFTTAHQQYAIHAIKINAFDYLLKPIDMQELKATIARLIQKRGQPDNVGRYKDKLLVNTTQVVHFIDFDTIVYLKAEGAYTRIVCTDAVKILSSKNLKFYEEHLSENSHFIRCHKSYIVNKNMIVSINKVKQEVTLRNSDLIQVALDKLDALMNF